MLLFFLHGAALSAWFVPLSAVLDATGYQAIKPFAFAAAALASIVSPLFFGAMADRQMAPARVLRRLALATAASMAAASLAMGLRWPAGIVLTLIQIHALFSAPTWSISTTIVLSRLGDASREFGPIRAMGTLGWMAGCWIVSLLKADASVLSGLTGAGLWLLVLLLTYALPATEPARNRSGLGWRERLGLDGLELLRNPNHRVVFIMAGLFSIPVAGFYPYTPPHLHELGFERTSSWMSLGQVTEIIAMFALGSLFARWRLKWIFACGLTFGVLRFALSAGPGPAWLVAGISLHGFSFALVVITAQIYLEERVPPEWRARAQALIALMSSGVGSLLGYLGTGGWFSACTVGTTHHWTRFWLGLATAMLGVLAYFLVCYKGIGRGFLRAPNPPPPTV